MNKIFIQEYKGHSKKTDKDFQCFKLEIGDWSTLIFPKSKFEYNYIKGILDELGRTNK